MRAALLLSHVASVVAYFAVPAEVGNLVAYYAMDEGTGWHLTERITNNPTAGIVYYDEAHQGVNRSEQTEANWVDDEFFGMVLACGKKDGEQKDFMELEDVDYGSTGKFTINIWFRHDQENFEDYAMENFFGHGDPSQLRVARNHIHWQFQPTGSVRTIFLDGDDLDQYTCPHCEGKSETDPCRREPACYAPYGITTDTLDEQHGTVDSGDMWHMLTLTPHPDGSDGYTVYLDGQVRSRLPYEGHGSYSGDLDELVQTPGGGPVDPEGTMRLCGRYADFSALGYGEGIVDGRYFLGKVAHVGLFNTAMTQAQVSTLLTAYIDHFRLPRPAYFRVWGEASTESMALATSSSSDDKADEAKALAIASLVISIIALIGVLGIGVVVVKRGSPEHSESLRGAAGSTIGKPAESA